MAMNNLEDVPWEMWWIFLGIFFFGLLMPLVVAQGLLRVITSVRDGKVDINFWQRLVLGWLVLVPVYVLSFYYFKI